MPASGRDEPVDDDSPRQRLDPADARLQRVHRPPMSTLDPLRQMAIGSLRDGKQSKLPKVERKPRVRLSCTPVMLWLDPIVLQEVRPDDQHTGQIDYRHKNIQHLAL
jgi:hypothetical protein